MPNDLAISFGIGRDLVAHGRPQHVGDLLADRRIVRLDLALAGVELEVLEPVLHRQRGSLGCVPVGGIAIAEMVAAPR